MIFLAVVSYWLAMATVQHGWLERPRTRKGKEKKSIYIAHFIYCVYLKALRHGSHSFTCKYTMPAFPSYAFIRWRHLYKRGKRHPIAAYYSSIDPEGMKG